MFIRGEFFENNYFTAPISYKAKSSNHLNSFPDVIRALKKGATSKKLRLVESLPILGRFFIDQKKLELAFDGVI